MTTEKAKDYERICSALWKANPAAIDEAAKQAFKEVSLPRLAVQAFPDISKLLAVTSKMFFFLGVTCMLESFEHHLLDVASEENPNETETN